jgi:hypothetical protein
MNQPKFKKDQLVTLNLPASMVDNIHKNGKQMRILNVFDINDNPQNPRWICMLDNWYNYHQDYLTLA